MGAKQSSLIKLTISFTQNTFNNAHKKVFVLKIVLQSKYIIAWKTAFRKQSQRKDRVEQLGHCRPHMARILVFLLHQPCQKSVPSDSSTALDLKKCLFFWFNFTFRIYPVFLSIRTFPRTLMYLIFPIWNMLLSAAAAALFGRGQNSPVSSASSRAFPGDLPFPL